jgi:hypothetical protein
MVVDFLEILHGLLRFLVVIRTLRKNELKLAILTVLKLTPFGRNLRLRFPDVYCGKLNKVISLYAPSAYPSS